MPNQYDIDTRFLKFLLDISLIMVVFAILFMSVLFPVVQISFVRSMCFLFLIFLTLFLGLVFTMFMKWFGKYKTSLFSLK